MTTEQKTSFWKRPIGVISACVTLLAGATTTYIGFIKIFVPDPVEQLVEKIEKNQRRIYQLIPVSIPDSLCDGAIMEIRNCQQRIMAYSKLYNFGISPEYSASQIIGRVMVMLKAGSCVKRDFTHTLIKLKKYGIDEASFSYWNTIVADMTRANDLSEECKQSIKQLSEKSQKDNNPYKAIREWIVNDAFVNYFDYESNLCVELYEYLNIMQLEYAYRIPNYLEMELELKDNNK